MLMPDREGEGGGGLGKDSLPAPERGESREKAAAIEKSDLLKTFENLKIALHWLIAEVKPAWQHYAVSQGEEKATSKLVEILEKSFKLPSGNKEHFLRLASQITGIGQEETEALRSLFYFKNLEQKGRFLKEFQITYYMELLSSAQARAYGKLQAIGVQEPKAHGPERQKPEEKQIDLPFDEIDPSKEEEL